MLSPVLAEAVLAERIPVLLAAVLHHETWLDLALAEQLPPGPPEIVWAEVRPAVVVSVDELLAESIKVADAQRSTPQKYKNEGPIGVALAVVYSTPILVDISH